jgi:integrase
VFPRYKIGFFGDECAPYLYAVDLTRPAGEWKKAWRVALNAAGLKYRWHDLRHTFVSRLAESPAVSEETIRSLAAHVSKVMLQRYSHIRTQAKRDAIATLEKVVSGGEGAQNWAQSPSAPVQLPH